MNKLWQITAASRWELWHDEFKKFITLWEPLSKLWVSGIGNISMRLQLAATRGNWFLISQILYEMAPIVKRLLTWVGMGKTSWNPRCLSLQEWTIEPNKFRWTVPLTKISESLKENCHYFYWRDDWSPPPTTGPWPNSDCASRHLQCSNLKIFMLMYVLFKIKIKLWKR
jgi:hypothetical protein